jgi:hypothetical protein
MRKAILNLTEAAVLVHVMRHDCEEGIVVARSPRVK